ncbi:MAG: hypothetical protein JO199_11145 [Candidatus Eremiobacteraeota bacterium]|nr:hypothetical protein [Candidatus Eremiobacteraeota bacterium]
MLFAITACSGPASLTPNSTRYVSRAAAVRPSTSTLKILYRFKGGTDAANPEPVLATLGGYLYGTTTSGGGSACAGLKGFSSGGCGTVFKIATNGLGYKVLHALNGTKDGAGPSGGLTLSGSTFYMTTEIGGSTNCSNKYSIGCGTIASMPESGTGFKPSYAFKGGSDAALATGTLVLGSGMLYGTSYSGGTGCASTSSISGCGTVFSLNPSTGVEKVLYAFKGGSDGQHPVAALAYLNGTLYGATYSGGIGCSQNGGCGTIFSMSAATGAKRPIYRFAGTTDGCGPEGVALSGTTLYVAAQLCGKNTVGTLGAINASTGKFTLLHAFGGGTDATYPSANVIVSGSNIFGVTANGGGKGCAYKSVTYGCGTVYEVSTTGVEKVLYGFSGGTDGDNPEGPVTLVNGVLYGTTYQGGGTGCTYGQGCGTVFSLTP